MFCFSSTNSLFFNIFSFLPWILYTTSQFFFLSMDSPFPRIFLLSQSVTIFLLPRPSNFSPPQIFELSNLYSKKFLFNRIFPFCTYTTNIHFFLFFLFDSPSDHNHPFLIIFLPFAKKKINRSLSTLVPTIHQLYIHLLLIYLFLRAKGVKDARAPASV